MKREMKIVDSLDALILALGIEPGDTIEITGSQHHRDYDLEIDFIPKTEKELKAIIEYSDPENLKKMGIQVWATYDQEKEDGEDMYLKPGEIHYLLPGEWYKHLPEGYEFVSIFGDKEIFKPGQSDDDIRFGCLSYGFIRNW